MQSSIVRLVLQIDDGPDEKNYDLPDIGSGVRLIKLSGFRKLRLGLQEDKWQEDFEVNAGSHQKNLFLVMRRKKNGDVIFVIVKLLNEDYLRVVFANCKDLFSESEPISAVA